MKNKILAIISACIICTISTQAQTVTIPPVPTNAPPSSPQNFLQTATGYFTTFGNLQTFATNDTVDIWTGAEYIQNNETAVCLGLSYNTAWKPFGGFTVGIESVTRNVPGLAGSAILSQNCGVNLQLVHKDAKAVAYCDPGYDFNLKRANVEIGVRIFKALTENTFAGVGIAERIGGGKISTTPTISVFAGVKF